MRSLTTAIGIIAGLATAHGQGAPLLAVVNVAEYFDDVYAEGPKEGATFVFFRGEPIHVTVAVLNGDTAEHTFIPSVPVPSESLAVTVWKNGATTPLAVAIRNDVRRRDGVVESSVDWGEIRLDPQSSFRWLAEVADRWPEPGTYILQFRVLGTDEDSRPIAPHALRFIFEVRDVTSEDGPEVIRREGQREFARGRLNEAKAAAMRLLALHPNSIMAYLLIADVAKAEGRQQQAAAAYQRALSLAVEAADQLYLRWATPHQVQHTVDYLRALVRQ